MVNKQESSLEIERPGGRVRDKLRRYRVWIDGSIHGTLRAGERRCFEVSPGQHTLRVTIDWGSSPQLDVDVAPGEAARFKCVPRGGLLAAPYWATVGRHTSTWTFDLRRLTSPRLARSD